jgi:cation transport regulator ChaB
LPVPRNLPPHAKSIYEEVMESLKEEQNSRSGWVYTGEERARIAWSAVKEKYKQVGDQWVVK